MKYLDPADKIIRLFGGALALSRLIGGNRSQIHRWRLPRSKGGCDGAIPSRNHLRLLALADERKIDISKSDLVAWLSGSPGADTRDEAA